MDGLIGAGRGARAAQKAEEIAQEAQRKAEGIQHRVEELERANEALTEVLLAAWDLISQKTGLTEAELKVQIKAVQSERAQARGRPREAPPCPQCGRPLRKGQSTCMYCGAIHGLEEVFDRFS